MKLKCVHQNAQFPSHVHLNLKKAIDILFKRQRKNLHSILSVDLQHVKQMLNIKTQTVTMQ